MIGRNDFCWCGSKKKWKKCHFPHLPQKGSPSSLSERYRKQWDIILKTADQIKKIRKAGHLAARLLDEVCDCAKEGVTTEQLDKLAYEKIHKAKAIPASLHYGYPPFPKSICTSLNEVICHGIPNKTPLKEGDIINIDLAVILDGYYGDCSKMVAIGKVDADKERVFNVSLACLQESAKILRPGLLVSEIGNTITDYAHKHGCSVVTQFVGHGVGIEYHEAPQVPHCRNSVSIPLTAGMIFTIEPMINAGSTALYVDEKDEWTARTKDGKPSAQWEWQFLITDDGYELLTPWKATSCELAK